MKFHCHTALCVLLVAAPLFAAVVPQQTEIDGQKVFVLENDLARIVVVPEAGAAISSYVDKRSDTEFVVGKVKPGSAGYGWKNVTRLDQNDPSSKWMGAQPYQVEVRGDTLVATCTNGFLRVEREMRLADGSTQLSMTIRTTNTSDQPQTIWARWHPYAKTDDVYAENSLILAPGPDPLTVRRIRVGQGYNSEFMDVPGYWMAINANTGTGLWMTFDVDDLIHCSAWTGTKFGRTPVRGWFVPEVYPAAVRAEPGRVISMSMTYQPFVAADAAGDLAPGFVADNRHADAARFVDLARTNAFVLRDHTMMPSPNSWPEVAAQNRFYFSHLRRDRFAMTDWGIIDAMMNVPGIQSESIRLRLFTRMFDAVSDKHGSQFKLTMTDGAGRVVKKKHWGSSLESVETRHYDRRYDVSLEDVPDGRYTVKLQAFDNADASKPVHSYVREVNLCGNALREAQAARREKDAAALIDRERPVVRALRTMELPASAVPIAVEEASGIARKSWPVRTGVPFHQGALHADDSVVLIAPDGKTMTPQTKVMSTWHDGSTRWLLVDFPADVPADSFAMYTLKSTDTAAAPAADLAVASGNTIKIDTGAATFDIATNADGPLFGVLPLDGIWWKTGAGEQYTFQPDADGVTIDENGSQRAVIKCVGWYRAKGQEKPIAYAEFRATFCRGQSSWKLDHTYTYIGDPWHDTLGSSGIRFAFAGRTFTGSTIELDGNAVESAGAQTLNQRNENVATIGKTEGNRASGAASLVSQNGNALVYHRGLWRLFPKQVDADPKAGVITYHYHPASSGPLDWRPNEDIWNPSSAPGHALAQGVSRTHEFVIDAASSTSVTTCAAAYDEPVLAIVAPRYLCDTGAIPGLAAYDPVNCPKLENAVSEVVDSYELNRQVYGWYGQWFYGSLPNMFDGSRERWADYGRYGNVFNEQDIVHGPWLAYMRSGDRRHFKFAMSNTTNLLDVGTIRMNPTWPDMKGMSRRHHEVAWLGPADYGHSMLDPFVEMYHVTGDNRAWEAAQRMASAMALQNTGTWRYLSNPIAGLARMYFETGKVEYKQQADRIWTELCYPDRNQWYGGDHAARMVQWYAPYNEDCARLWKERANAEKPDFETIDSNAALYRSTGDITYAKRAEALFDKLVTNAQGYDPKRENPLEWSAAAHTQHVLAAFRQWMYASDILQASRAAGTSEAK